MRLIFFVVLLFTIAAQAATAADVAIAPPIVDRLVSPFPTASMEGLTPDGSVVDFSGYTHVRVTGEITGGDVERLKEVLPPYEHFQMIVVSFDSEGGNYVAGLELSDFISARSIATYVGPGDSCFSACALAFLGGREEVIRNVVWWPKRIVHVDGRLGFHAPFNDQVPDVAIGQQQLLSHVAEKFYGIAREAIRAVQARLERWQVMPALVLDFLGKGRHDFLEINRARELRRNRITVVTHQLSRPKQIGALGASLACDYVLSTTLEPASDYRDVHTRSVSRRFFTVEGLANANVDALAQPSGELNGAPIFHEDIVILGRGPFTCDVALDPAGEWRVRLSGDLPRVRTWEGVEPYLDAGDGYAVNEFTQLGLWLPWTWRATHDLRLGWTPVSNDDVTPVKVPDGAPFHEMPTALQQIEGPSFDCSGELDRGAKVICRFPMLAKADGIMAALYRDRLQQDAGMRNQQRVWVKRRDSLCRPAQLDLSEPSTELLAGYCLLFATMHRIRELLATVD